MIDEELPIFQYTRDFKVPYQDNAPISYDDPITCLAIQEFLDRIHRQGGVFGELTSPKRAPGSTREEWYLRVFEVHAEQVAIRIVGGTYNQDGVLTLTWQPVAMYRKELHLFQNCTLAPRMFLEPSIMPQHMNINRFVTCDLTLLT